MNSSNDIHGGNLYRSKKEADPYTMLSYAIICRAILDYYHRPEGSRLRKSAKEFFQSDYYRDIAPEPLQIDMVKYLDDTKESGRDLKIIWVDDYDGPKNIKK